MSECDSCPFCCGGEAEVEEKKPKKRKAAPRRH